MSLARLWLVARCELGQSLRRPMVWVWIALLGFAEWGLSTGGMQIASSGDTSVGGTQQWLTSEFSVAYAFTAMLLIVYVFFASVAAGMTVIRDGELRVGQVLHGTPLRPGEYVWGKYLGILVTCLLVVAIHLTLAILFLQVVPSAIADDTRGPFALINYVRPALVFLVPALVFVTGVVFAIGELTRRPVLVFVLPVVMVLGCGFFLWNWSPRWLDPRVNQIMMLADPTGMRWLLETWLKIDLGVAHYNLQPIGYDWPFLTSRLVMLLIGLAPVAFASRHYTRTLRGVRHGTVDAIGDPASARTAASPVAVPSRSLAELQMSGRPPGLFAGMLTVARFELKELRRHPGLYLFVPFILMQTLVTAFLQTGAFDTPILYTPGGLAISSMNTLTLMVCMLLLFYTVESQLRERHTNLGPICYASAVPTGSLVFGKTIANAVVGAAVLLAALVGCVIALIVQGTVPLDGRPFLLVWGLLMIPTFMVWSAFVAAVLAITRNRYTTYAVALAVFVYTLYRQLSGQMSWVGNWDLWSIGAWSDISRFELDRSALLLNRLMVLGLAVLFTAVAVRFYYRRDFDATRIVHRLRPTRLLRSALWLLPFLIVPVICGGLLRAQVVRGFQGEETSDWQKDYWKQNLATWRDAPLPTITRVELDLEIEPERRSISVDGVYELKNLEEKPIARIPLTTGPHWRDQSWSLNGDPHEPEDRSGLIVFAVDPPLPPGDSVTVGFRHEAVHPLGITKNGGGTGQFILPSGVVLHSFTPSFAPVLGYMERIGVDEDNEYEPRDYPDDFYEGVTEPLLGGKSRFTTRIRVSGPDDFVYNSVGVLVDEQVSAGRRTALWESDFPVTFFNVVAGRWAVSEGKSTKVFYDPQHHYNVAEITSALEDARTYYSQWFMPYPWKELKISEFPALASYAQGFPTNITFSESIGFLTRSDERTNTAFTVTAHEAAHQWWGNLLQPGMGPGGNILSEGMAHFSTILLIEQSKGLRDRIEFCKRIEEGYGDDRRVDAERPLVKTDGSRSGDRTVMYDKGGWVVWMLLNLMGRDQTLEGLRAFITHYSRSEDRPVLQDLIATLRRSAPDVAAFDGFVDQWFFDVVVPEYKLRDVEIEPEASGWVVRARLLNEGSGRMPVQVAAMRGERFDDEGIATPEHRDDRVVVAPGEGEAVDVLIRCDFEPDRLVVDPDALVLQLKRDKAMHRF